MSYRGSERCRYSKKVSVHKEREQGGGGTSEYKVERKCKNKNIKQVNRQIGDTETELSFQLSKYSVLQNKIYGV